MIGLARGAGKGISQISKKEKDLIEEHDLAVFSLGSFEDCIRKKKFLLVRLHQKEKLSLQLKNLILMLMLQDLEEFLVVLNVEKILEH